ncbi:MULTISPECIES: hypothetical protein [unclassified Bradyrhizobium]|uniref:hypothetical protein n=1 Tax=unclassified Bradyrhizobium TaxID=2631580 RepID=UPI002478D502|nr:MULTISPECIES: hypothetical protein [unclassified Bradyrhizobium]WGS24132.1 hypothetical protein MTX22_08920 [Bradyrhizobium sp. ISRA463]WGS31552.1 hypothetical protein MTX19_06745 [Bradyrhizobium sp. ISRA464]
MGVYFTAESGSYAPDAVHLSQRFDRPARIRLSGDRPAFAGMRAFSFVVKIHIDSGSGTQWPDELAVPTFRSMADVCRFGSPNAWRRWA